MKPVLFLITNNFPFGRGESFLLPELEAYKNFFSRIIILSKNDTDGRTSEFDASIFRVSPVSPWVDYFILPFLILQHFTFLFKILLDEIRFIAHHGRLRLSLLQKVFHDAAKALLLSRQIEKIIAQESINEPIILYSYWLNNSALATLFTFRSSKTIFRISRAHSGDLYEYRHQSKYLSFRKTLLSGLHQVYTISEDGKAHLLSVAGDFFSNKIAISRLGTSGPNSIAITLDRKKIFCVASCSYLLPVKQVDKILKAVAIASSGPIRHLHIGGGELESSLKKMAQLLSKSNPKSEYFFTGNIPPNEIGQIYSQERPAVFINASKTEGIPVAMMEALSHGIPVIAPDVGAIRELVTMESGLLLSDNPSEADFAQAIESIRSLPDEDYQKLRRGARHTWETKFNAAVNFPNFATSVLNLSHAV